jgi:endonuclease-3
MLPLFDTGFETGDDSTGFDGFDIDTAFVRLREVMPQYPPAAMSQLAAEGHCSLFEQLVACIISIRTYDEVSLPVSRQLFAKANTPAAMARLSVAEIERLIAKSTYAERKAGQIWAIAQAVMQQHSGNLPCDETLLLSFSGVGPKCAHLALGIACEQPYISVDVHVHRVVNRWGYVATKTPEKTTQALTQKLPKPYWIETNQLLMPFGKNICKNQPKCSSCPLADLCPKVGVVSRLG